MDHCTTEIESNATEIESNATEIKVSTNNATFNVCKGTNETKILNELIVESSSNLPTTCLSCVHQYVDKANKMWSRFTDFISKTSASEDNEKVNENSQETQDTNEKLPLSCHELYPSCYVLNKNVENIECSKSSNLQMPLGFSFSPAGWLLPYHLGVLDCLNYFNILTPHVPLAGASAGAIAIACAATNISIKDSMRLIYDAHFLSQSTQPSRTLHVILEEHLTNTLPENAHVLINSRPSPITIGYATVWPRLKSHFPHQFKSLQDLKECIIASCNVPFYFSRWPTVNCRGYAAVDGYFASTKTFGCPKTGAQKDILVIPFPPTNSRFGFSHENCISPALQQYDNFFLLTENKHYLDVFKQYIKTTSNTIKSLANEPIEKITLVPPCTKTSVKTSSFMLKSFRQSSHFYLKEAMAQNPIDVAYSLETHHLATQLPKLEHSVGTLLKSALNPKEFNILLGVFQLGQADCYRWLVRETVQNKDFTFLVKHLQNSTP